MITILDIFPTHELILNLPTADLGWGILRVLNSCRPDDHIYLHRRNFFLPQNFSGYPTDCHGDIQKALMEGWAWLENEELIAPDLLDISNQHVFVTRKGQRAVKEQNFPEYCSFKILPKELLHPTLLDKCYGLFMRDDHDIAVFQAGKEIEVAVRKACNYDARLIGTRLMRQAFKVDDGPLSDENLHEAERQGWGDEFAGIVATCKNPNSHDNTTISKREAAQIIIQCSRLLDYVDRRLASKEVSSEIQEEY